MTEEINQKILQWMSSIESVTSEELPKFIQEIATYGFYEAVFLSALSMLAFLGISLGWLWIFRNFDRIEREAQPFLVVPGVISLIAIIPIVIGICENPSRAIKAKCAPKLYVIERMMKK